MFLGMTLHLHSAPEQLWKIPTSGHHIINLEPNIFPSSPPTQSDKTQYCKWLGKSNKIPAKGVKRVSQRLQFKPETGSLLLLIKPH